MRGYDNARGLLKLLADSGRNKRNERLGISWVNLEQNCRARNRDREERLGVRRRLEMKLREQDSGVLNLSWIMAPTGNLRKPRDFSKCLKICQMYRIDKGNNYIEIWL